MFCFVVVVFFNKRVEGWEESPHPPKEKIRKKKGKKGERDEEREREREQTTAASSISHYIEYSV